MLANSLRPSSRVTATGDQILTTLPCSVGGSNPGPQHNSHIKFKQRAYWHNLKKKMFTLNQSLVRLLLNNVCMVTINISNDSSERIMTFQKAF